MESQTTSCDNYTIIKPSSSSMKSAPSWSDGCGADTKHPNRYESQISPNNRIDDQPSESILKESDDIAPIFNDVVGSRPKMNIEIPTVYLTRKSPSSPSFHIYQILIKPDSGQEWSVYRRYSQFLTLHQHLKALEPEIGKFVFPPKKRINSKASTIVRERRTKLEDYIKTLNYYVERLSSEDRQMRDMSSNNQTNQNIEQIREICQASSAYSDSSRSDLNLDDSQSTDGVDLISVAIDATLLSNGNHFDTNVCRSTKVDIISLFYEFISFKDKKNGDFDLESLEI